MKQSKHLIVLSVFALFLTLACSPADEPEETDPLDTGYEEIEEPTETIDLGTAEASATLTTADGTEVGTVTFTENENGGVTVSADLHDVETDGMHGFHVHEGRECSAPTFESAGGHFNPQNTEHACPPTTPRHAGDFGNVEISDGSGTVDEESDLITVAAGANSVVGRAVILHNGEDDCTSQPSGDAGDRYACGVIETGGVNGTMGDGMGALGDETEEEGEALN